MNYIRAKIEAQKLANARNLNHVILFNGKDYSVAIAKRHKGNYFELVEPNIKAEVKQPKKGKSVQKSEDI